MTLRMLCKWDITVCNLSGLTHFPQWKSLDVHSVVCSDSSLSLLSNVPQYGCSGLFDRLPVEGHLGGGRFLAITNKVAVNLHVQVVV